MGLFKAWKELKAISASGAPTGQAPHQPHGMMMGFAAAMGKMVAPLLAVQAPERGDPLPGTEPGVLGDQDPAATQAGIAGVRARDSAFDPQLLTTFADQVFAAVCSVWGTGDASAMRPLLADALWDPLAATLASGLGSGPGTLYSHQTGNATMAGVWAGTFYDSARFTIAVDLGVPIDPQQKGMPPGFTGKWTEDWLFQRSVQPGGDPMKLPEACPSCGAPTAVGADGLCAHCRQPIPVLTAGWLVSAVRSHNPVLEMYRAQMVSQLRANPEELAMVPDELLRLLPADDVASIDPRRAAALGLRPSS